VGGEPLPGVMEASLMRRAIVFPGQGSKEAEFSGVVLDAVRRAVGDGEVPYQLSVFAGSVEVFRDLRERGVEADVVAGHSLGEYAAAFAAGSLGLEDAVRLVTERDRLMNEASRENPGAMIALVGADPREVFETVEAYAGERGVVVAANFNTPRQTVISGEEPGLDEVADRVKARRKIKLRVAGAFHSPLMEEASVEMERLLERVEIRDPEMPMVGGMDGGVLATAEDVRIALKDQMLAPVRWVAVMERFEALGVREVVEAGRDGTLARMLRDFENLSFQGRTAKEALA
jgi:[acyl-carrier-protein] S-malonyltransferase